MKPSERAEITNLVHDADRRIHPELELRIQKIESRCRRIEEELRPLRVVRDVIIEEIKGEIK